MRARVAAVLAAILMALAIALAVDRDDDDAAADHLSSGGDGKAVPAGAGEAESGDPLLARARTSMQDGRIDPALVAELRASDDPAHARARRLLAAFAGEAVGDADADAKADVAPVGLPPIVPPAADPGPESATAEGGATPGTQPSTASAGASEPTPSASSAKPRKQKRELSALSFTESSGGATLTIKAPGGVTVGVVNQPSSGNVILMIEGATASPSVVSSRPRMGGAAVTRVRKGEDTVQITLSLAVGWKLESVKPFAGGARVKLRGP